MKGISWVLFIPVLALLGLLVMSFTRPASAILPSVQGVIVFSADGNTYLNITVSHTPEIQDHYVDTIEVTFGSNTTDLSIGVQQLRPDDTFVITYNVGPVSGISQAMVRTHCIVNGWSTFNWTGPIPEFPLAFLSLSLLALAPLVAVLLRKTRLYPSK